MENKTIIVGRGEIGNSLAKVLEDYYPFIVDKNDEHESLARGKDFDIMHVCFPYSDEFVSEVKKYQAIYKPVYTVIHSTVKPGTCRELGAISSPVIGIHPHLEKSIRTFVKFLAGEKASEVADYFRRAGLRVYLFDNQETTETMKILDTTFYGICVEYAKEVKKLCKEKNIPFEAWTLWTDNYNEGYKKLGYPEFVRPNLTPIMKRCGGHCVLPNAELMDTPFTRFLKSQNT